MPHSQQAIAFTRQAGVIVLTSTKIPASEASAPDVPERLYVEKVESDADSKKSKDCL